MGPLDSLIEVSVTDCAGGAMGTLLNNALKALFGIALISAPESILNLIVCWLGLTLMSA